jgi:hypothetical protein
MKRFPFLVVILLLASSLAAREVPISEIRFGTPPGERTLPSIAAGTGGYLAAWVDERNGTPTVFATRLTSSGEPLDRHGLSLGFGHDSSRPQVIWNGGAWLVFWSAPNHTLVMARVDRNGAVTPAREIADWAPPEPGRWAATNGSVIVLAHGGSSWGNFDISKVYATVLSMEGEVLSSRIVDTRPADSMTVLANDNGFAVSWNTKRIGGPLDLEAIRLDARGDAIDTAPRFLARAEMIVAFMRNGGGYVAVFSNFTTEGPRYFSFAVNASLEAVNTPAPVGIKPSDSVAFAFEEDERATLAIEEIDGATSYYTVLGFSEDGRESGRRRFVASEHALGELAIIDGGTGLAAAWIELQNATSYKLEGALFDDELQYVTPERALTETAPAEGVAKVAAGRNEMLVASRDAAGVRLRRITFDGVRLDEDGVVLTDVADPAPEIVFDGTRYVIAYVSAQGQDEVVVRFLETDGTLHADEVRIPANGEHARYVALARGRTTTAIGWITGDGVHAATLEGTRLSAAPRLVGPGLTASLQIAFNGSHYLFVWREGYFDWDMVVYNTLLGRRFVENLTAAESQPVELLGDESSFADVLDLAARSNGEFVLALEDRAVHLMRIDANLHVLARMTVASGHSPRLASEGDNVVLAWTTPEGVLRSTAVTADGTLAPGGIAVTPSIISPFNFGFTSDVALRGEKVILVYARRAIEAGSVPRVFVTIEGIDNRPGPRRRVVR